MDDDQQQHTNPTHRRRDALDQLFVPRLGLSVGHAGRHLRRRRRRHRRPLPARRAPPGRTGPLPVGDAARSTCPARSPSACWCRSPSTSRPVLRWLALSSSSASWADGRRTPPWPSRPRCWPRTATSPTSSPTSPRPWSAGWRSSSPAPRSVGGWCRRELLPHSRPGPPRGARRRGGRRPACPADPPCRPAPGRPAARRDDGGQRVGLSAPGHPDRTLALPRPGIAPARRRRGRALRRVHDLVHGELGDDAPAPHRPPHRMRSSTRSAGSPSASAPPPPASGSWRCV